MTYHKDQLIPKVSECMPTEVTKYFLSRLFLLYLIQVLLYSDIYSQDVSQISTSDPIKIKGSLALNLGVYQANGISSRRDPFSYLVLGRLNFNLFGVVDVPVGVSLTQQENNFSQPFNHYGLSPQYKWVQAHLGYRSLQWSPYTLSGHTFLGVGVDVELPFETGPKVKLSAMRGRLRRSVDLETAVLRGEAAAYRRRGYGFNLTLTSQNNAKTFGSFNVFHAADEANSIEILDGFQKLLPEENVTIGFSGQWEIFTKVVLSGHYGFSAFTRDQDNLDDEIAVPAPFLMSKIGRAFLTPNASTQYNDAFDVSADWQVKTWALKFKYQRIDPSYETLGSYYFQNDLENVTLSAASTLHQGKIRIYSSLGQQRNNLEGDKTTRTKRLIGSLNYNHSISDRMAFNGSFSNYSSNLKVMREELSDTLNFYQINTSATAGVNYVLGRNSLDRSIFVNATYQVGNSRDEYRIYASESRFLIFGAGYRWKLPAKRWQFRAIGNYSRQTSDQTQTVIIGPNLNASRTFAQKKINASYTLGYNWNLQNQTLSYGLLKNALQFSYRLNGGQRVGAQLILLSKANLLDRERSYSELRGKMSYKINF